MIYTDFEKFKRINAKYGYRVGDQILRQFSEYVISTLKTDMDTYFTRAISDHFILFTPCDMDDDLETVALKINQEFLRQMKEKYPDMELCVRTGIYLITKNVTMHLRRSMQRIMQENMLLEIVKQVLSCMTKN